MDVPAWGWVGLLGLIAVMLTVDFVGHVRKPHAPSLKEATIWSASYISIALMFGIFVWQIWGSRYGSEYYAGYVTEESLSVDNLFVFVLIMSSFRVPRQYQQKVLLIGIMIALALRTIFIFLGAAIVNEFSWVFYIFGAFLLYTAYTQVKSDDGPAGEEFRENLVLRLARRVFPTTDGYVGDQMLSHQAGKWHITPMLIVMLAIGSADLLFAVDSIPAIFGLTRETYLIFAANAFSLMGLRQLYFLIDGLLDRLVYLKYGLAAILGFIGIKLVIHAMHENDLSFLNGGQPITLLPEISTNASLVVIVGVLIATAWTSLTLGKRRRLAAAEAEAPALERDGSPR